MKGTILLASLVTGNFVFAAGAGFSESDFIERAINFVIFAVILYLLFAKRLREFLDNRSKNIGFKLSEIQNRLKQAKYDKEQILKQLESAKENATEIINAAKREVYTLTKKIEDKSRQDIQNMIKNVENLMVIEQKNMEKQVVSEALDEVLDLKLDSKQYPLIIENTTQNSRTRNA